MKRLNQYAQSLIVSTVTLVLLIFSGALSAAQTEAPYKTVKRYNLASQLTGTISTSLPNSNGTNYVATRNTYNTHGRLIKSESGYLSNWQNDTIAPAAWTGFTVNYKVEYGYNSIGQKVSELVSSVSQSDTASRSLTQYSYDYYGRVACQAVRMNPDIYDSLFLDASVNACELESEGDQGPDRITAYTYNDRWDKVAIERRAVGVPGTEQQYAVYGYSAIGEVNSVLDANNNLYQGETDGFGRLVKWRYPEKGSISKNFSGSGVASTTDYEQFTLDNNGNPEVIRKRNGNILNQTFDNLNQLTVKDAPNTNLDVVYDYDHRGLQLSAKFFSTQQQVVNGQTVINIIPGNGVVTEYDGFGRIERSTNTSSGHTRSISHQYDANGNRTRVTHTDNVFFTYQYDGGNRLQKIIENAITPTTDNQLINQTWDAFGRADTTTFGNNGLQTTLTYDGLSRLRTFGHSFADTNHNLTVTYGYNASSQVLFRDFSNKTYLNSANKTLTGDYQVNGLNQYRCHGSTDSNCAGGQWLNYDNKGNLTAFDGISYAFDDENRLISRTQNGVTTQYTYDPMGRLVKSEKGSEVVEFVYDGDALVAEYNASNSMQYRYVHGSRVDNPLVSYSTNAVGASHRTYLHSDHQGSIVAHSDNSGERTQHNTYDEYGIPGDANQGRFAYTGQITLPFSDLYHYKARIYHPKLGRFLQTDPIGYEDQVNLYAYVHNDPMSNIDPSGENTVVIGMGRASFRGGQAIGRGINKLTKALTGKSLSVHIADAIYDAVHNESGESQGLAPETELVRGGDGSRPFSEGSGVTVNPDGTLDGVSVNGEDGVSGEESAINGGVRNGKIRIGTVGQVEEAGGEVIPDGKERGNNHCTINGCTEQQLNDIFNNPIPNPAKKK